METINWPAIIAQAVTLIALGPIVVKYLKARSDELDKMRTERIDQLEDEGKEKDRKIEALHLEIKELHAAQEARLKKLIENLFNQLDSDGKQ